MTENKNDKQILRQMILSEAAFYDSQMSDIKLKMFVEEMSDLTLEQIHRAYFNFRKDPKRIQKIPMPSEVRQFTNPELTEQNQATTAAALIITAVGKFGHMRGPEAREYIGELGWSVVQMQGGWSYICENLGIDLSVGTFQAQARNIAIAQIERAKAGQLTTPPGLPEPQTKTQIESTNRIKALVGSMTKEIK